MIIVFPLFSRLTGKNILLPHVYMRNISPPGRDLFCKLLGGKILGEANIQNGRHKLEEKSLSFIVFEDISGWFLFYVWWEFYTQRQHKTFMSSLQTPRQKKLFKNFSK